MTANESGKKRRRRIFSIRLRTILILLTVFCIWFGWYVKRAREQKSVTQWIHANGGSVVYRQLLPFRQQWLENLVGIEYLTSVESASLFGSGVTEISRLRQLPWLKSLTLNENEISDIAPLRDLHRLEILSLASNPLADVSPLKNHRRLQSVNLNYTAVSDITVLETILQLKSLDLGDTLIVQSDFDRLRKSLPGCRLFWARVRKEPRVPETKRVPDPLLLPGNFPGVNYPP